MNTHTPGPWKVHDYTFNHGEHNKARDVGPPGIAVAIVIGAFEQLSLGVEAEANARLIAAAPDMLAALREIAELTDGLGGTCLACHQTARAAIAKAEGA